jgi:hypothetical protein
VRIGRAQAARRRRRRILFNEALAADGAIVFAKACELGLEGIVSKRQGSLYKSGRSRSGLKTKNPRIRQDVITLEKIANTGHRERRLRRDPANVRQRISPPRRATVTSDQELFAKGLATYQRVVAANYMAHEQVGNLLHEVLLNEAKDGFVFADLGCGTLLCRSARWHRRRSLHRHRHFQALVGRRKGRPFLSYLSSRISLSGFRRGNSNLGGST